MLDEIALRQHSDYLGSSNPRSWMISFDSRLFDAVSVYTLPSRSRSDHHRVPDDGYGLLALGGHYPRSMRWAQSNTSLKLLAYRFGIESKPYGFPAFARICRGG